MGAELGRISGPLLADNLVRNGVDLTFRNYQADPDLVYLDVASGRIGINTATPSRQLEVSTKIRSTNFRVDTLSTIGNYTVSTNRIANPTGIIYITPNQASGPTITATGLSTDNLQISSNLIQSTTTNSNINISPNGTGKVNLNNSVEVNANLHATGNITFDGNITLGNEDTDNVVFSADVNSDILPSLYPQSPITDEAGNTFIAENNTDSIIDAPSFNLGSNAKQWGATYSNVANINAATALTAYVDTLYAGNLSVSGSTFSNTISANPLNLIPSGSGLVNFNGVKFFNFNNIVNSSDGALVVASTRYGYTKFAGTGGIVIPTGTVNNRPTPVTGYLRYLTDQSTAEIYNGTAWVPAIGSSPVLTLNEVTDAMDVWTLILG